MTSELQQRNTARGHTRLLRHERRRLPSIRFTKTKSLSVNNGTRPGDRARDHMASFGSFDHVQSKGSLARPAEAPVLTTWSGTLVKSKASRGRSG